MILLFPEFFFFFLVQPLSTRLQMNRKCNVTLGQMRNWVTYAVLKHPKDTVSLNTMLVSKLDRRLSHFICLIFVFYLPSSYSGST